MLAFWALAVAASLRVAVVAFGAANVEDARIKDPTVYGLHQATDRVENGTELGNPFSLECVLVFDPAIRAPDRSPFGYRGSQLHCLRTGFQSNVARRLVAWRENYRVLNGFHAWRVSRRRVKFWTGRSSGNDVAPVFLANDPRWRMSGDFDLQLYRGRDAVANLLSEWCVGLSVDTHKNPRPVSIHLSFRAVPRGFRRFLGLFRLVGNSEKGKNEGPCSRSIGPSKEAVEEEYVPTWAVPCGVLILTGYHKRKSQQDNDECGQPLQHSSEPLQHSSEIVAARQGGKSVSAWSRGILNAAIGG